MKFKTALMNLLLVVATSVSAFADGQAVPAGTTPAAGAPAAPGMGSMLVPFALMFAVMYFLMIRPQQKRMKEQQNMINALKDGDEVLTSSGFLGTVKGISDRVVTLEVDRNVQIKMLKSQIAQVVKGQLPEQLAK